MRLDNVSHGHTFGKKIILRMIKLFSRMDAPDVVKTLMYRPAFFGDPFSRFLQSVMRGPSFWTVGERELFASYTSHLEACHF
ncbi:MAG TPA: hypothetical protein VL463_06245 [Kofleriaceae bacterium]|jgi:hypothetical protein|nr:hypothetical protein [Kofleriaceae bacterium]